MSRFRLAAVVAVPLGIVLCGCQTSSSSPVASASAAEEAPIPLLADEKGGADLLGHYELATNWPQPLPGHEEWVWGATIGIVAESPNRIIVAQRGELPRPENVKPGWNAIASTPGKRAEGNNRFEHCLYVVDANGKIIEEWTQWDKMFVGGRGPHKLAINPHDPEKHIWVVDDMLHQIFKMTNDGNKIVLTLGERLKPGEDEKHFNRPTDIAFLPDGTFFVSDGYANTRVVKFDKNGTFLKTWGKRGTGPGEFDLPHGIATDRDRRVYVADRSNARIQVFDEEGKFLDAWPNIDAPHDVEVASDGHVWVSDGNTNKMLKYTPNGKLVYGFGTYGLAPGLNWGIHQFSGDADGNMYWAETYAGRAQKLRPRAGADRRALYRPLATE
jgi:sugar lactone lactonase YvrE